MHEIVVPRGSTNDDVCTLREWSVADSASVGTDSVVALVEDSKTVLEVNAGAPGVFRRAAEIGTEYKVGDVIGYVLPDATSAASFVRPTARVSLPSGAADMLVTKGARELMMEGGVSEDDVRGLGRDVIRRSDIAALLQTRTSAVELGTDLGKQQRAIARVVSESHRTIPKAFLLVKMGCEALLKRLEGQPVGLTEVLVRILGDLAARFPTCYARLEGTRMIVPEGPINVGVTFDLGSGLFIPVIHGADGRSLADIRATLAGFRDTALEGLFKEPDLTGGHISLSLNLNENVVLSLPIIVPGQAAIVSLGGILQEVAPAEEGTGFVVRRYVNIGLAYDHRLLNGAYAMDFLEALRRRIEYPGSNRWLP
jgi:2-oxoglutarate dehydrogenase E2 component (dihydrolipoamide succinyltransferase)